MEQRAEAPRILLIDDDPTFRNLMAKVAARRGIALDAYESLLDLGSVGLISGYDVAIVDYHLEQMTGIEIAEYLKAFFAETPMVLVSILTCDEISEAAWPAPIVRFMNKNAGCEAILNSALAEIVCGGKLRDNKRKALTPRRSARLLNPDRPV